MKYTQAFKERVLEKYESGVTISKILQDSRISKETLYRWIHAYEQESDLNSNTSRSVRKELANLQECLRITQLALDRTSNNNQRLLIAEEIYKESPDISIPLMSRALMLPKGTVYNRLFRNKNGKTKAAERREKLKPIIEEIYNQSRQTYGAGRIVAVLHERSIKVSEKLVADIMHQNGMFSIRGCAKALYLQQQKRRQNLLQQNFTVSRPNEVWVSDITYFNLHGKIYYICVVLDLYARFVVSWNISKKNSTQTIIHLYGQKTIITNEKNKQTSQFRFVPVFEIETIFKLFLVSLSNF